MCLCSFSPPPPPTPQREQPTTGWRPGECLVKNLFVADQRPDEVGVKHLCVPSYITLHALVCFPSGGCKGGGENGRGEEREGGWGWGGLAIF